MIIAIRRERDCYSSALIHQHTVKTKSLKLLNPDNVIHVPQIVKIVCVCVCLPLYIIRYYWAKPPSMKQQCFFCPSVCLYMYVIPTVHK